MCVSLLSRKVCKKLDNLFFKNLVEIAWHFLCRNFPLHIYFGRCLYRVVEVVVKPQTFHVDTLLVNALPFGCTCSGLCALLLSTYVRPRPCGRACVRACVYFVRMHLHSCVGGGSGGQSCLKGSRRHPSVPHSQAPTSPPSGPGGPV